MLTVQGVYQPSETSGSPSSEPTQPARPDVRTNVCIFGHDGSMLQPDTNSLPDPSTARGVVDIPADLVLQQNTMIDCILDYVFDTLGLCTIELRVYEERCC